MGRMAFRGGTDPVDGDATPWERAGISVEVWEGAIDVATIEYEALVRRLAEIYAQGNVPGWLDGRERTAMARRRIAGVIRGERGMVDRVVRGRHTRAG